MGRGIASGMGRVGGQIGDLTLGWMCGRLEVGAESRVDYRLCVYCTVALRAGGHSFRGRLRGILILEENSKNEKKRETREEAKKQD